MSSLAKRLSAFKEGLLINGSSKKNPMATLSKAYEKSEEQNV
jgi:hypothetical protein